VESALGFVCGSIASAGAAAGGGIVLAADGLVRRGIGTTGGADCGRFSCEVAGSASAAMRIRTTLCMGPPSLYRRQSRQNRFYALQEKVLDKKPKPVHTWVEDIHR
jgi:hypothetical protein